MRDPNDKTGALGRSNPISTCRNCKAMCVGKSVKYGIRHYLCAGCAIGRGSEFLATLKTWQLEQLPAIALKRAGLFEEVARIISRRKIQEVYAQDDRGQTPEDIARRTGFSRMEVVALINARRFAAQLQDALSSRGGATA